MSLDVNTLTTFTWLIPAWPLLAFFVIVLFTKHNKTLSWGLAWAAIITSLVMGWLVAFNMFGLGVEEIASHHDHEATSETEHVDDEHADDEHADDEHADDEHADDEHADEHDDEHAMDEDEHHGASILTVPTVIASAIDWLPFGECGANRAEYEEMGNHCPNWLTMGVAVDPLTAIMLLMVPFAVAMIFVYSVGYHNYGKPRGKILGVPNHGQEEPLLSRFFAFMCLFAGAMLVLVVADNLLLLFVGWEIMGLCSYLLIGFWYARTYKDPKKIEPRWAAVKAFMTTRVGDVFMLLGIVFFYRTMGTLNFADAFAAENLARVASSATGTGGMAIMALLLFIGTVGKSAQWPLHVWLPDAMEGPTPVSAVIHAAAMVSAGVYMVVRIFPLITVAMAGAPWLGMVIGGIGAFTALMAATIALGQNDVKGVLAYSTISQLGFMVAAIGIGAYVAAAFHLITHGFFKALLFLGSGSVIHGMEHGAEHVHDHHTDPQDMRNMGGLAKKMPWTFVTFVIGGFALSGFPLVTAGFWSKDEILADAIYQGQHGNFMGWVVFIVLAIAAFLTAFYTMRQISMTFLGKARTPLAEHAHESNGYMILPLVGLSIFAVGAGWLGIPDQYPEIFANIFGGYNNFFHHFVGMTVEHTFSVFNGLHVVDGLTGAEIHVHEIATLPFSWTPVLVSVFVALGGLGAGYLVYGMNPLKSADSPDPMRRPLGPLYDFFQNKWYWDELYTVVFIKPVVYFSEVTVYEVMDKGIIDGILHLVARVIYAIGAGVKRFEELIFGDAVDWVKDVVLRVAKEFRSLQTGKIQEYALMSLILASVFTTIMYFIMLGAAERLRPFFEGLF